MSQFELEISDIKSTENWLTVPKNAIKKLGYLLKIKSIAI